MKNQVKQASFKFQVNNIDAGDEVLEIVLHSRVITFELVHKTVGKERAVEAISPDGAEFSGTQSFTVDIGGRWVVYNLTSCITQNGAALILGLQFEESKRN